ncbi:GAP family protein [Agromyces endophyticus]|uniref:GAP family protein n=1 Tax=Agromyces sp. H17E-10 TaxID=2932244 RepID=UPI001FD1451A|nr:GAP family protein [Agromyces sp. H17E-10]UOQ90392.1 GAP family protein [Agromyces sp. H17E-10]
MSGVLEALVHVVPIAIAVAASSVPILVTLTILLSPNAERLSGPFLAGWLVGMTALVIGCTVLAEALPREGSGRKPNEAVGIAEIVVGVLIIAVAAIGRLRKPGVASDEPPKWLASMNRLGPWEGFALGAVLNLRPKSLLLIVAAALSVRGAELTTGQTAIVLVVFIVLGASTVAVPIIAAKVSPSRTAPKLTAMREWMARHSRTVTGLILLVIGVFVIVTGIGRL